MKEHPCVFGPDSAHRVVGPKPHARADRPCPCLRDERGHVFADYLVVGICVLCPGRTDIRILESHGRGRAESFRSCV